MNRKIKDIRARHIIQTNTHRINDYDMVLDARFGKCGTQEREKNEDKARDFYTAQIIS